jgi:benzoyl-CoA reductase/2-hydroxyglutaryl-CoA dehydratase subunit BcrC/BadD/HgdB
MLKSPIIKSTLILLLAISSATSAFSQYSIHDTLKLQAIVYQGDTIPMSVLSNIYVQSILTNSQKEALAKYNRLRNAVYVTYPYARKAGIILNDINKHLATITEKQERKKYIKSRDKELKKEFSTPITNLSVYQGKILMKLINRETGNNCYEIIKEYQGGLTARLYQTVAFFFDSNLKQPYNAQNDDLVIEKIVREVQRLYGYAEISKTQNL